MGAGGVVCSAVGVGVWAGAGGATTGVVDATMGVGEGFLFGMMVDAGADLSVLTVTVIPLAGIAGTCTVPEVQRTC